MNTKSLKVLEFAKIIDMLSEQANSKLGKDKCKNLLPSTDLNIVLTGQKMTSAAKDRIRTKGIPSFLGLKDIKAALKRLEIGSNLSQLELLNISDLLKITSKLIKYGVHEDDVNFELDILENNFRNLNELKSLAKELDRCILSEDTISDEASHNLSNIRKKIKASNSKIHAELNSILGTYKDYLMDGVITMRNNSYVLPIKAEYKNKIQGVVHDQSSSGSTYFIEPLSIIKLNNEIKELEIEEKKEIEVILANLSALSLPHIESLRLNQDILVELDFTFAKAKYSNLLNANEPIFNDKYYINIKEGRHPLLPKDKVVPINISLGKDYELLIITGPNTGGKTVSLKTIGLFTLMGQAGLHIPAFYGSELSIFNNIFADIGDEQSIEQNLSTFSSHMTRIVEILEKADSKSLCLFDELGAGTDPTEGAALAISILSFLLNMKTRTIATTHYSELKVFALNKARVENASCEFDISTLKPTYKILIGVAGRSNAFAISKKLGLPEYIIEDAKKHISTEEKNFEDLLIKLEENRLSIEKDRSDISSDKKEIEKLKKKFKEKEEKLEKQTKAIIDKAKEEANQILRKAKETADESIKNINKISSNPDISKALELQREKIRKELKKNIKESDIKQKEIPKNKTKKEDLKIGDTVFVHSMNMEATISSTVNDKNMLFVQIGILRTQVKLSDISLLETKKEVINTIRKSKSSSFMKAANISPEINVIAMNVDEACAILDKYLDDAILAHLDSVKIIHGRGTGALQKGIHSYLKRLSYVKSYKLADFEDGGTAITIVNFK